MTHTDLLLEKHLKQVAKRPPRKNDETQTSFDRDIFWYDKDELSRQADYAEREDLGRVTYEDHRKAVETAVLMMRKETQHEIAMCILTHRAFKQYRAKAFAGEGSFRLDYAFLVTRVGTLFNSNTGRIKSINLLAQLQAFTTPTLVVINHIIGTVDEVKPPSSKFTLNEWAQQYNLGAAESTSYRIVGMQLG